MTKLDIAAARILIVGAKGHAGPVLRTVLTATGVTRIVMMDDARRALDMLCSERFTAVFVEGGTALDDLSFAQAARRSPSRAISRLFRSSGVSRSRTSILTIPSSLARRSRRDTDAVEMLRRRAISTCARSAS